jgi:glutamate synthase domain-containing protein 2
MSQETFDIIHVVLSILTYLFVSFVGLAFLAVVVTYILDVTQTKQALRRNYPVVAHFRYFFEHLGEFFRQYFFAMDREEMPFNRAQRSWVYRAAKNLETTQSFGSTRDIHQQGALLFVNCPFPTLGADASPIGKVTIGEGCPHPYTADSVFNISGMSYGALSKPAVQALSRGAKMAGCWMNTGEGGVSPYHLESGCDLVYQIGTAKYGVRDSDGHFCDEKLREVAAYSQIRMFEIKLSQGAKPGKGGILPGAKVSEEIARIRGIEVGQDSISPNRHPEINSAEDLLDMIAHVREVTGKPVGFKCVMGAYSWLDRLFELVQQRGIASAPDFITLDSADGGTGAAPTSLMDYMGLSIKESLPLLVDRLHTYGLKERIKVITSGKLINPADVAWALCMGADFIVSARGFMMALGCIQALQCSKNTCPTGITSHNPKLQKGLDPDLKALRVKQYLQNLVYEVGVISHSCGVKEPRQLQRYHCHQVIEHGRSRSLADLYPLPAGKANIKALAVKITGAERIAATEVLTENL